MGFVLHMQRSPFGDSVCLFLTVCFLSKIYDKAMALILIMHAFPFWMVTFPVVPLCGVYVSQLISFARVCGCVGDVGAWGGCLDARLLRQGDRYHKHRSLAHLSR